MRNLVCVVIDGLGAGALGCYGNTWLETPAIDRLAADSLVFDQAIVDSPELMHVYRGWWQGVPAGVDEPSERPTLPALLADANYSTCLLTDESSLATHSLATGFDQQVVLPTRAATEAATTIAETNAAQFFAASLDVLGQLETPYCAWLHSRGMFGSWDAPRAFRERWADDEDPPPPEFVDVPSLTLPENDDPDHLLGIMQAYGGQVALFDECFGGFWEQFVSDPQAARTLLALMSPRGFPLGEHRAVGLTTDHAGQIVGPPYSELVHAAWLMRLGDGRRRLDRSMALVQPIDFAPTVLATLSLESAKVTRGVNLLGEDIHCDGAVRPHASMATASHVGLRTPSWHYTEPRDRQPDDPVMHADERAASELYVKPDDRWEVNNVASLCRDEAEQCKLALDER